MKLSEQPNGHTPASRVGVVFREHSSDASTLAARLREELRHQGYETWSAPLLKGDGIENVPLETTDVLLVLGGDGSILSAARLCAPLGVPILGINFGRVGFLTELEPDEVDEKLPLYLRGDYWTDERTMLQATVEGPGDRTQVTALNDIVMVRGAQPRVIRVKIWLDGYYYNTTVADGILVSTATGSTAYNLAAGGPILHPQVRSSVLTPIVPHLATDRSLILEPGAGVTFELQDGSDDAILSADGQINHAVAAGAQVTVSTNTHMTRFLRRRPPTYFYRILSAKLRDNL